jgi:hypothetical protein
VSTADWFLAIAFAVLTAAQILMGLAITRWLKEHERVEFKRADDHHMESKERLDTHEDRAIAREERAIERDRHMVKLIEANNANTRAAIDMRLRLQDDVADLKVAVKDIDGRVQAIEVVRAAK